MGKEVRMAAPKKLSAGQIINQLRRAEVALANGKRVKQVCRELGVSEQTYYRWRKEYGGMPRSCSTYPCYSDLTPDKMRRFD